MKKEIRNKVKKIVGLAIKVSTEKNVHVFVQYSPHTCEVSFQIYIRKWKAYREKDAAGTIYLDYEDAEQKLDELIDVLENLIKYGVLKVERNGEK